MAAAAILCNPPSLSPVFCQYAGDIKHFSLLSLVSLKRTFLHLAKSQLDLLQSIAALPQATPMEKKVQETSRLDFGKMGYGCKHYRRRCKIRAPCCDEVFGCRHCHNESTRDHHEMNRRDVERVICLVCDAEQPVAQVCSHCGVQMGEYFCGVCKFFDDDIDKAHYHCDDCGICRVGGKDNYFHCKKCGSCYSVSLRNKHSCVENAMRNHCPICYEYLFDSLQETAVLKCGHTLHSTCFLEMLKHEKFCCPICSRSVIDMSKFWKKLDEEVEATIMPEDYQYKVWNLCNDCNDTTEAFFHVIGQKCSHCNSYNTRTIAPPVLP